MGRENKKEAVAALHRDRILKAAENLIVEKGFAQTTIDDISKASEYSRRTIYAYYKSKDDILYRIIEKGLQALKADIELAVNSNCDFVMGYREICMAMSKYHKDYPYSMDRVNHANTANFDPEKSSNTLKSIMDLGTEINHILESFIETGKRNGIVRQNIVPMLTVYVLWSSIQSLLTLVDTKGQFICEQYAVSEEEFFDYGWKQIINSILEERI